MLSKCQAAMRPSLSRKGGTARDGSVMVPLAWVMLMAIAGVLLMPAKGTWLLSTVPPSIKVRKATLLLVQVKSHAAATLLANATLTSALLNHFLLCLFCWWTGTIAKHKTRSCLMYEWLTLAKGMMNEPTGWLAAVAVQATEGCCVCVCVCQSFWSGRMINERGKREGGRERKGEGVRGKRDREG